MFQSFAHQKLADKYTTDIIKDVYARANGHLGLTSFLGKILEEWVSQTTSLEDITLGGRAALLVSEGIVSKITRNSTIEDDGDSSRCCLRYCNSLATFGPLDLLILHIYCTV